MRAPAGHIAFGPFHLDTEVPRLVRDGVELDLRPQALHALRTLARNSGHCVDYAEMIGEAWHGVSVSRHTVAVTVGEVKKALKEYGGWISYHPKFGYRLDVPQSEELIRNGWHYWLRHTREGFDKALGCFNEAVAASSTDFRGWEGISRCYLMLATFAMRNPREMYAAFLESHNRAVELAGLTPELRGDRAQGLHVFELKFAEAEAELLKARAENPRTAGVHVRLAVLYASTHRTGEALDMLTEAYAADSLWPILPAAEILVRCCRGEFDQAAACGKKALDLHPYFALGRSHYAQALEFAGRIEEALEHYQIASLMNPDFPRLRAEQGRCLARCGRRAEAAAILRDLEKLRETDYVDGYALALLYESLDCLDEALTQLERAAAENSPALFMLDVDPRMDGLRSASRFTRLRNRLFRALPPVTEMQPEQDSVIAPYRAKEPSRTHRVAS